jgi:peptide/nickel transport system substrate-binding protein
MLMAAFGDDKFFKAPARISPRPRRFHSKPARRSTTRRCGGAKKLLAEAKYDGAPIRILNSKQYEFHHNMALVMAEQLKAAGFKVQLDVVDWATLVQRRADPALYDVYITHSTFFPEPMLSPPQLGSGAPGWWDTPAKTGRARRLQRRERSGQARRAVGEGAGGRLRRGALYPRRRICRAQRQLGEDAGFAPMPMPAFWNVGLG